MLRRLEGRYVPTLAIALIALVPYILVTSAARLYEPQIGSDVGISKVGLSLSSSFATAGYAFGALLCGDLVQRFRKHRLFPICGLTSAIGWAMAAAANGPWLYAVGSVLQGLATGMLLVVALPPTIQNFEWKRVPLTAAFINIGLFGAVAAGPLLGGAIAAAHGWRWLYAGFAVVVTIASLLAIAIIPDEDPPNPDLRFDWPALLLGIGATALPFGGVAMIASAGFGAPIVYIPLALGITCFIALLVVEYRSDEPLAPVKPMSKTLPVIGTLVATFGGGVFVTLMELTIQLDQKVGGASPLSTGVMFWPQLAAVLVAAVVLGTVFKTRYMPVLVLVGMIALLAGGALLLVAGTPSHHSLLMIAVALLGLGAGLTVSPGLFLAGFSLESKVLGRIVALVELVRSVGDFLIAPVMLALSKMFSGGGAVHPHGIAVAVAISLGAALATTLLCVLIYATSGLGLPRPQLKRWLEEDGVAIDSPPLFARFRS
jgi:MFS family permease